MTCLYVVEIQRLCRFVELTVSHSVCSFSMLQESSTTDCLTESEVKIWWLIVHFVNKLLELEYSLRRTKWTLWRTCWYKFTHHTVSLRVIFNIILHFIHQSIYHLHKSEISPSLTGHISSCVMVKFTLKQATKVHRSFNLGARWVWITLANMIWR
jgi:hypothetical protein